MPGPARLRVGGMRACVARDYTNRTLPSVPGPGIAAAAARREAFVRASAFVFIHALRVRFALLCA